MRKNSGQVWDMLSQVQRQRCRYYPGDERPAYAKKVSLNGRMFRLALEQGVRGWIYTEGGEGPLSMQTIRELASAGMFSEARAYADYEVDDQQSGMSGLCVWRLGGMGGSVQFVSPGYVELQQIRVIEAAAKRPKARKKTLAERDDIL